MENEEMRTMEEEMQDLLDTMDEHYPDELEYEKSLDAYVKLKQLEIEEAKIISDARTKVKQAVITGVLSLAGIGLICSYERLHVITSKALGFVHKPKY